MLKNLERLARLNLTIDVPPAEANEAFQAVNEKIKSLVDFVSLLSQVDTTGVEPLFSLTSNPPPPREDEVVNSNTTDDILKNAPEKSDNFFVVPRII